MCSDEFFLKHALIGVVNRARAPNNWETPLHLSLFTTFWSPNIFFAHPIFLTSLRQRPYADFRLATPKTGSAAVNTRTRSYFVLQKTPSNRLLSQENGTLDKLPKTPTDLNGLAISRSLPHQWIALSSDRPISFTCRSLFIAPDFYSAFERWRRASPRDRGFEPIHGFYIASFKTGS